MALFGQSPRCNSVRLIGPKSLLADFEIVEEPPNVGKEEIADLGLLVKRWIDFPKRVFQVKMLVGKGKCGANLFETRRVLAVSQEAIGLQGGRCSLGFNWFFRRSY
jgi:hypothetical protein